ncbi:MAG: transglutaminase-like domain-containing protein [Candidatus Woesearchaeota archaeon]
MHQKDLEEDLQKVLEDPDPPRMPGSIKVIGSIVIALTLIFMIIPYYAIHSEPEPDMDFSVDIQTSLKEPLNTIPDAMNQPTTPEIRSLAIQITQQACSHGSTCHAKALFYFVRDSIGYIPDPPYDYIQHPHMTMEGAGDCEDQAILLHHLYRAIGIESHIVTVPNHAYVRIHMPNAPTRYHTVNLDPTCRQCDFGEIPSSYSREKVY